MFVIQKPLKDANFLSIYVFVNNNYVCDMCLHAGYSRCAKTWPNSYGLCETKNKRCGSCILTTKLVTQTYYYNNSSNTLKEIFRVWWSPLLRLTNTTYVRVLCEIFEFWKKFQFFVFLHKCQHFSKKCHNVQERNLNAHWRTNLEYDMWKKLDIKTSKQFVQFIEIVVSPFK